MHQEPNQFAISSIQISFCLVLHKLHLVVTIVLSSSWIRKLRVTITHREMNIYISHIVNTIYNQGGLIMVTKWKGFLWTTCIETGHNFFIRGWWIYGYPCFSFILGYLSKALVTMLKEKKWRQLIWCCINTILVTKSCPSNCGHLYYNMIIRLSW